MSYLFIYRRLDDQLVACTDVGDVNGVTNIVTPENAFKGKTTRIVPAACSFSIMSESVENVLNNVELRHKLYDYNSVEYFVEQDELWLRLTLPKGDDKDPLPENIEIKQADFDIKITETNKSVRITKLQEYLNCVEYLRVVSLATHVISLLIYDISQDIDMNRKDKKEQYIRQLEACITRENIGVLKVESYEVDNKETGIVITIQKCIKDKTLTGSTAYEVMRAMGIYLKGGVFGYYRGVGHAIYPDVPSIFRESNKREEDRWYREMKTQFQNDLEKKSYLDRLAMLQHYELPTRMLDVTSSPLVALYMSSNTIYTNDASQKGTGEIIMYYDGAMPSSAMPGSITYSCDNYGNDIAYIHDGKSYDSGVVLILAALAKLKYENKERMRKVITTFQYLIDCVNVTDKQVLLELVNRCVHTNATHYEKFHYLSADERYDFSRNYGGMIAQAIERPDQICDILWDICISQGNFAPEGKPVCQGKEEFHDEYIKFIPSYKYILATVRRENSAFKDHINIFDLIKCFHVKMGRTNDRIQAQAGSFIICGLNPDYIRQKMLSSRSPGMVRFFVTNKKEIMRELNALGFNDSTMIPDMAHHAEYMKARNRTNEW